MDEQIELIFHDTIPLPSEELEAARAKATTQREVVLEIFRRYPGRSFSPYDIEKTMDDYGIKMLITSIRRSITDLTKEGRLIKCDYSERKQGRWGMTNRTWRYNIEYMQPLNARI
jgi:Fe2+ or Zn2+ uptake regulation protein